MGTFCLIVTIGVIGYFALKAFVFRQSPQEFVAFDDGGNFNQAVVGESSYQGELLEIAGLGEVRHDCMAVLVQEDQNQFDSNAVAIYIDDRKVGYLSRTDAKRYRKNKAHGGAHGVCPAVIVGGGRGRENLGVWLDISF